MSVVISSTSLPVSPAAIADYNLRTVSAWRSFDSPWFRFRIPFNQLCRAGV